jgi:hypothetical protein
VPFQFTVEPFTKLAPFTVNVNAAPPAVAEFGDSEVAAGTELDELPVRAELRSR